MASLLERVESLEKRQTPEKYEEMPDKKVIRKTNPKPKLKSGRNQIQAQTGYPTMKSLTNKINYSRSLYELDKIVIPQAKLVGKLDRKPLKLQKIKE